MQPIAKPGAGLPVLELLFLRRLVIPVARRIFSWESALKATQRETDKIARLIEELPEELRQKQVLIDKVFAIEHHTRTFSINMVLEHLAIVDRGVGAIVATLSQEKPFAQTVTIEAVKPRENSSSALADLQAAVAQYGKQIQTPQKQTSKATHDHPWFGPFTNFDWHILMAMHTLIHRRQIEAILRAL